MRLRHGDASPDNAVVSTVELAVRVDRFSIANSDESLDQGIQHRCRARLRRLLEDSGIEPVCGAPSAFGWACRFAALHSDDSRCYRYRLARLRLTDQ